jgi:hypothetical protein
VFDFGESSRRLRKRESPSANKDKFRGYTRFYLSRVESLQWHHVNPDLAERRRAQIVRRVKNSAVRDGVNLWALFDADEILLIQGAASDTQEHPTA